jgi:hypothetical protein
MGYAPGLVLSRESRACAAPGLPCLQADLLEVLHRVAQDYDDIAEDLEGGAIEIRHPELMPQRR